METLNENYIAINSLDITNESVKKSHILVLGKRGCGKSTLVKNFIKINKISQDNITVMSRQERFNTFYKDFVNENNIFFEYDSKILENLMYEQKEKKDTFDDVEDKYIIIDDCVNKFVLDNQLKDILMYGKDYKIHLIICVQYMFKISQEDLTHIDYIFLFKELMESYKKKYYNIFAGFMPNYNSFNRIFDELSKDEYSCMVIYNNPYSYNMFDKILHYKTPKPSTFNEYELNNMVKYPHINIIAKRGSGKLYLIKDIIQKLNYKNVVVISRTERFDTFFGNFLPKENIKYEYKSEIIEKILSDQENQIKKFKEGKIKEEDAELLLVLDDCLSCKGSWVRDQPIQELLFNARHYKIGFVLTMQYPLGITPELRCNFDYVYLFAEDFVSNIKRIYEHYAGCFPNFCAFKEVYNELTKDYKSMVIVNRGVKTNIYEKIFYYKVRDTSHKETNINLENNVSINMSQQDTKSCDLLSNNLYNLVNENKIQSDTIDILNNQIIEKKINLDEDFMSLGTNSQNQNSVKEMNNRSTVSQNKNLSEIDKMILLKVLNILESIVNKIYN